MLCYTAFLKFLWQLTIFLLPCLLDVGAKRENEDPTTDQIWPTFTNEDPTMRTSQMRTPPQIRSDQLSQTQNYVNYRSPFTTTYHTFVEYFVKTNQELCSIHYLPCIHPNRCTDKSPLLVHRSIYTKHCFMKNSASAFMASTIKCQYSLDHQGPKLLP